MIKHEDIDKTLRTIDEGVEVYRDVKEAKEDGKITLIEGGELVVKHSGKAVRFIGSLSEIGDELTDIDGEESEEIFEKIATLFGASDEAVEAIGKIAEGAGLIKEGIEELIDLKKEKENQEG